MAKCLRKTIRKKKSKRSHIFGWIVVVLAMLLTLISGEDGFTIDIRKILTWIVAGVIVITFVFVLLGTYIYNILGSKDRGIIVNLSKENNMTSLDSIDILKLAIAFAIVSGILNMILAIIMLISGMTITTAISNIIVGFVGGFIEAALLGAFYNFLAPKIGKIKLELIDL